MGENGSNAHSLFLKSQRHYCYQYGKYWRIVKNNVYYGSYDKFSDAKKISDRLKEYNWDKSKLKQIQKETNITPRPMKGYGSSGIYNVHIKKDKHYKQGYIYTYPYVENGENKLLSSTSLEKLKEKVLSKKLEWYG